MEIQNAKKTEWEIINPRALFPIAYLTKFPERRFFRHYEINLTFPTIAISLSIIALTLDFLVFIPLVEISKNILIIIIFFNFFMFLWSYLAAVLMDPGFLPYNWDETRLSWYPWEEQLSGIAIDDEQFSYVSNHARPKEASFSHKSGRFVIRGDHFCGWISNWVAKRNHKQFILMLFWGSIFVFSLVLPRFFVRSDAHCFSEMLESLANIFIIFECFIATFLFAGFISQIIEGMFNNTKIKEYKNPKNSRKKCEFSSLREIFGNSPICLWLIPIPAFGKHIELTPDIETLL